MALKMGTPKPKATDKNVTLSNAIYSGISFDVSGEDGSPQGIFFNPAGTKMFMIGRFPSDSVHQYTLGTGFDLSTASYDSVSFSISGQDGNPRGIFFNATGTRMFMVGATSDSVHQYSLTSGFDISSATYDNVSLSVGTEDITPTGIFFNGTGNKMFMVGRDSDFAYQYTLGTAFDLSTASYDSVSFDVSSQSNGPTDIFFNSTGTKMFVVGNNSSSVFQYTLGSAFDLSSASYDSVSLNLSSQDTFPQGIFFNSTGTRMFMVGNQNDLVYQYNL